MINVELGKDKFWKKTFNSIIESYTPGLQIEPNTHTWQQCDAGHMYEVQGYVEGELYHVFCEDAPEIVGAFFTFLLDNTRYYISANKVTSLKVVMHRSKTFFKIKEQNAETGKYVVMYWRTLSKKEDEAGSPPLDDDI